MKILSPLLTAALLPAVAIAGREPAAFRPIHERVRFSTHIVVGEAQTLRVINEVTGKEIPKPSADLDDGQQMEVEITVETVLQADNSRKVNPGSKLKARFGRKGDTPSVFKKMFSGKKLIFFLSRDAEHASRFDYFYPFFGETNLIELPTNLQSVMEAIARLGNAAP